uniref:Pol protein n=1 Tax=Peronospora matthiolae TaxID=2874970 RepID=A0AAV1TVH3_9STRA
MRTHPTFYVGRLKPYHQYAASSDEERPCAQASRREPCGPDGGHRQGSEEQLSHPETDQQSHELPLARHEEMSELSLVLKLSKGKLSSMPRNSVRQLETPVPLIFEIAA